LIYEFGVGLLEDPEEQLVVLVMLSLHPAHGIHLGGGIHGAYGRRPILVPSQ
jgi:hypothetical protein